MYVVPTPFRLATGVAHQQTLILPADVTPSEEFIRVGELRRVEAPEIIVGYSFNLKTNEITPDKVPNPAVGREHAFRAWRLQGSPLDPVSMQHVEPGSMELEAADEE